jgi:hypothetical protein
LRESKIFWPLVLFPFAIDNAHKRSYTGRCWIKDIKASFSFANIILTNTNLICRFRMLRLLIFDVSLQDIDEVKNLEDKPDLIQIKYRSAIFGKLTKLALSGQPAGSKNQIILNVMDEQKWLNNLKLLSP